MAASETANHLLLQWDGEPFPKINNIRWSLMKQRKLANLLHEKQRLINLGHGWGLQGECVWCTRARGARILYLHVTVQPYHKKRKAEHNYPVSGERPPGTVKGPWLKAKTLKQERVGLVISLRAVWQSLESLGFPRSGSEGTQLRKGGHFLRRRGQTFDLNSRVWWQSPSIPKLERQKLVSLIYVVRLSKNQTGNIVVPGNLFKMLDCRCNCRLRSMTVPKPKF